MSAQNSYILEVENLSVSYATPRRKLMAVDGISFQLKRGETFGLVGESGSGKTTAASAILRLLSQQAKVESGRVLLNGVDLLKLPENELRQIRWQTISWIPQGAMNSLNPVMKVKDQICDVIVAHQGTSPSQKLRERILALLQSVNLPERVYTMYPHELSGGMKQRVCIAMAIALSPQLIIADEPTSALDVVVQRIVSETLKDVQKRLDATLVLIGHDMGIQAQLVDRLAIMYQGKLVEVGPVNAIFKNPVHAYTQRLIASIPSISHEHTLAQQVLASGEEPALGTAVLDSAIQYIPPLREVGSEHYAAVE